MPTPISKTNIPPGSLLANYEGSTHGFTDCYFTQHDRIISLEAYIDAFYNSLAFLPERHLIGLVLRKPANRSDISALSAGTSQTFSAWTVEARLDSEILLADVTGATRSWLKAEAHPADQRTTLYFGSAVIPRRDATDNESSPSGIFRLLTPFHKLYSRVLLAAASQSLNQPSS